jgi:predicted nucleotidyltransferase
MTLINNHINAIYNLCAVHKVKQLYAFGSVLTEKFNKDSDIDLVVDFEPTSYEFAHQALQIRFLKY